MNARSRILARIRERQAKPATPAPSEVESVASHLAAHPRNAMPRDSWTPLARFRERALSLASTVDQAESWAQAPSRVASYLEEHGLPKRAVSWPELVGIDWRSAGIAVEARSARADDLVGITGACCAIAETGTLVVRSGAQTPATVSLLPETHIALVRTDRVVAAIEDAWALLREDDGGLPRAVNFISGPSRTADIEQTVTLGAHGPYRVHIVLVSA